MVNFWIIVCVIGNIIGILILTKSYFGFRDVLEEMEREPELFELELHRDRVIKLIKYSTVGTLVIAISGVIGVFTR